MPGGLVGGADLVPDHVGDDRRAVVRHDHHLKTVGEREVGDIRRRRGIGAAGENGRGDGETGDGSPVKGFVTRFSNAVSR